MSNPSKGPNAAQLRAEVTALRLKIERLKEIKFEAAKARALLADVFYALSEPINQK